MVFWPRPMAGGPIRRVHRSLRRFVYRMVHATVPEGARTAARSAMGGPSQFDEKQAARKRSVAEKKAADKIRKEEQDRVREATKEARKAARDAQRHAALQEQERKKAEERAKRTEQKATRAEAKSGRKLSKAESKNEQDKAKTEHTQAKVERHAAKADWAVAKTEGTAEQPAEGGESQPLEEAGRPE
jgi:penicillin-binding protein 1A